MKLLNELYNCSYETEIKGIKINSKEVEAGDLFVCTKGVTADRHDFIDDAIKNGASALITSKDVDVPIPYIKVDDPNDELAKVCSKFYDHPEEKLKIIGITGTDGKTSVATIVQTLIGSDKCGYIGTNGRKCAKFDRDTNNTTPDSDKLFEYFNEFFEAGCKYVIMEASSEAFYNHRLNGIEFDCSGYTNITSEHLNTHGTLENYIDCKKELFRKTKKNLPCILNSDDDHYNDVIDACSKVLSYGKDDDNDFQIISYKIKPNSTDVSFKYKNTRYDFVSPLMGEFNVYNLACAMLMVLSLGFDMDEIIGRVKDINVSGRLDLIDLGQDFKVMVDYAHTPNGIYNLLKFVNSLNVNRSIVVIGQAGERDPYKRPKVGEVVVKNASYAIFTYEDPRSEDPASIIDMMVATVKDNYNNYEVIIDRSSAIKKAIDIAKKDDIVLVLGKGNETYEKLNGETIYFNDIEETTKHLKDRLNREKNGILI